MSFKQRLLALFILLFFAVPSSLIAQINNSTLTVYLDCRSCNETFIRSEIDFVNFVRDQSVAEVQLLITSQGTGGGGRQFTLEFFGLAQYVELDNKLIFISPQADTDELRRNRLVKYIKLGLVNYLSEKDVIDELEVNFVGSNDSEDNNRIIKDPWNGWNFDVGFGFDFSGEQKEGDYEIESNFRARKITEEWKVQANYEYSYNNQFFVREDSQGEDSTANFIRTQQNFFGLIAKSLSDHWTAGAYINGLSSTQRNYDLQVGIAPSIEYSIFPYSEFARREIIFRYGVLAQQNTYTDTTIFNKKEEFLFRQNLDIQANFTQPWGGIFGRVEAGNYLHDFSKNSLEVRFRVNMRISRSFSFFVSGRYERINDQLSISSEGLSDEDIFLNLKQQATSYRYGGYVGLEFNFGSIYNNVVNSRF
ncbi:MAG: hypothetical protein JXR11_11125 [Balneola sp.]